jgi:hypothetical protein
VFFGLGHMVHKIKNDNEKFDSLDEFIDNLSRGGEIEFIYKDKKYSITHPDGKLSFIEQYNEESLRYFNSIQELLDFSIEGDKIKDIVTIIQPFFRCF